MTSRPSPGNHLTSEAKELLLASKRFAHEQRWRSWWHLGSTLVVFAALIAVTATTWALPLRVLSSVVAGLVLVRIFILYHDFQHGSILARSPLATAMMWLYGLLALNPPSIWKRSHDHHHRNNSKMFGASIGSYPVMTTEAYAQASRWQRFAYAASRHPITIGAGYFTIFMYGMCLRPFLLNPLRHFDALLSLVVHLGLVAYLATIGPDIALLSVVLPTAIAATLGAYLFYAQHNYPTVKIRDRSQWSYVDAALNASSYIVMSPWMHWFTGNIGYHHVHHLNARIPFYRLPEAMAALPSLQSPGITTLLPSDIWACFRLKLWDRRQDRLISFAEAQPMIDAFASGTAVLDPDFAERVLSELHSHQDDDDGHSDDGHSDDGHSDDDGRVGEGHHDQHRTGHGETASRELVQPRAGESVVAADLVAALQREIPVAMVTDATAAAFELPAHGIPAVINTP